MGLGIPGAFQALAPQQIRRVFRSYLRAYLPTPQVPTSPVVEQRLSPVIQLDDLTHIGAKVQPLTQWGTISIGAAGAGTNTGILCFPGRDGLYLDSFELSASKTVRVFTIATVTTPTGWTSIGGFGDFFGYNPADPLSPPIHSGVAVDPGPGVGADTNLVFGNILTAQIPGSALIMLSSPNNPWPRNGQRIYLPPNRLLCIVNNTANSLLAVGGVRVTDPTFATNANI